MKGLPCSAEDCQPLSSIHPPAACALFAITISRVAGQLHVRISKDR